MPIEKNNLFSRLLKVTECPNCAHRRLRQGYSLTLSLLATILGLYISEDNDQVPKRFRGLGVRIEDDVVIQDSGGPLILSRDAPKRIADVEEACAQR